MDEQLKELFKKAFNEGVMYEATLSKAYGFDSFIEDNIEQLRLYRVSNRTWSSDEIINQLYQFESIDEAKRWFSEYGCPHNEN